MSKGAQMRLMCIHVRKGAYLSTKCRNQFILTHIRIMVRTTEVVTQNPEFKYARFVCFWSSMHDFIHNSISLPVCLSVCLSIHLCVYLQQMYCIRPCSKLRKQGHHLAKSCEKSWIFSNFLEFTVLCGFWETSDGRTDGPRDWLRDGLTDGRINGPMDRQSLSQSWFSQLETLKCQPPS